MLETCTPDQIYVMLASVHSRFPAGRPQLATADALTTAEGWRALVPVLEVMPLAPALRQVLCLPSPFLPTFVLPVANCIHGGLCMRCTMPCDAHALFAVERCTDGF